MADEQLTEIVREGRRALAKWRRDNPDVVLDLVEADLSGCDLAGSNLRRGNLLGANLSQARLVGANLSETDLTRANLSGADLSRADCSGARLFRSQLCNARLHSTNLAEAVFQGADLSDAVLVDTTLANADLREADLAGAELLRVNLSHVELDHTNFERVRCGWSIWVDIDLSRASGLESMSHVGPGSIGVDTLERSAGRIPVDFLRGNGVSDQWVTIDAELEERAEAADPYFITFAQEDEPFAGRLHNTLQKQGVRCWLVPRGAGLGDLFATSSAERGSRIWDRILLCATQAALSADWMDGLVDAVLKREEANLQATGQRATLMWPLNLDGFLFSGNWKHPHANEVAGRVLADFTGWRRNKKKFAEELKQLIQRLKEEPSGRAG